MKALERIASLETDSKSHHDWLKHLEQILEGPEGLVADVAQIKTQVNNHIPTQIGELKDLMKWIIGLWVTSLVGLVGYLLSRR